jgi:hypothetical protein
LDKSSLFDALCHQGYAGSALVQFRAPVLDVTATDLLGDFRTTWFFGKMGFDRPYSKQSGREKDGGSLLHRIAPSDDTKCGKT